MVLNNPIKPVLIGLIFSLSLFNFNLNGQTWFETYSSGEDHSIPIKYPGDDHHFSCYIRRTIQIMSEGLITVQGLHWAKKT